MENGERGDAVKEYACAPFSDYQRRMRRGSVGVCNHEAPRLSKINMERIRYIKPGGNWIDIPKDLLPKGMKRARKSDHTKRYGRVTADGLASTILTKCDPHWGAYFHYSQDRSFTVREAARIQSFPDHYLFEGNQADFEYRASRKRCLQGSRRESPLRQSPFGSLQRYRLLTAPSRILQRPFRNLTAPKRRRACAGARRACGR